VEEGGARLAQVYPREPGEASFRRTRHLHLDEVGTLGPVPQLPVEVLVDGGGGRVAANRPASARHTRTIRSSAMIQCDSTADTSFRASSEHGSEAGTMQ